MSTENKESKIRSLLGSEETGSMHREPEDRAMSQRAEGWTRR